jgi:acyl-[acyl-carrier-protein]-phospholipid O-acyltransferase / long-chain-fatty-acid--[acyl-carrier-protein] ligase
MSSEAISREIASELIFLVSSYPRMTYRQTLAYPGLQPFLWTQFLGAFNDNIFKMVVSFLAMDALGEVEGVSLVGAVFILPFLLFSGYAGHLADRFGKRSVLVSMKWLEIVAMALAVPALLTGHVGLLLAVLFLMAAQSTFFSPAKYGLLPELLPEHELSRANGLLEMSTFVAIVIGTSVGGLVYTAWHDTPEVIGMVLVAIAVVGTWASHHIPVVVAAAPHQRLQLAPWGEIVTGLRRLLSDRTLWMTAVGASFFWFLGALLQLALLPYATTTLGVNEAAATQLYTALAVGIGIGSLVAGRLSGSHIELGLVPLGSLGMGAFALALAASSTSYVWSAVSLMLLGFSGGFFAVPLNALLQHRPAPHERGRILATANVMQTVGILLASAILWFFGTRLGWTMPAVFAASGVFTLVGGVYVLLTLPAFFIRFTLWLLTHTVYRITVVGKAHVPTDGPALLICNHVSMVDGILVGASVQRFVRFLIHGPYYRLPGVHFVMSRLHGIPITAGDKADVDRSIARARQELLDGHVVCIFAEGAVSRTGNLLPFRRGFERILEGLDVPVIPVYLDRVWGSVFSFKRGKFFWKRPEHLPYPVTVAYGPPLPATVTAREARLAVSELGTEALRHRHTSSAQLHHAFIRTARRHWGRLAVADSTGQTLTYGRLLTGAILLSQVIRQRTAGQVHVGLLLPASVGGAVANLATLMAGRMPVNLNFTTGADVMSASKQVAGITTVITSKRFLDKAGIAATPDMIYLEDLRDTITGAERLAGLLRARLTPQRMLRAQLGSGAWSSSSTAAIIFSSGSTGVPKGVVLTHANLLLNVESLTQVFHMHQDDCFIGVLPFFHSFGLTGTLWFPLLQGCAVAYHPNPMDAKTVGELAETYKGSMLISTPTFVQSYLRRCTRQQFAHLRYAIVGAEKLREPLARAFQETFGIGLLEGYGCTEMAPVVAANVPDQTQADRVQVGTKPGSVGHPIPGVAAKVVDTDTGEGPLIDRDGLLLVKGPNMMAGYLNDPVRTADAMRDGWYVTGDIARIDQDGFIFITDRLSRFSKIGGEMVPHIKIEDTINDLLGELASAVTAVPCNVKGERLVVFYTRQDVSPAELWDRLMASGLPRLWIPKRDDLVPIEAIPTLGTGKIDLQRLKALAGTRA